VVRYRSPHRRRADNLRPQVFRDPTTGEAQRVLVRDYVVKDIDTNRRNANCPCAFAVTIPRENMDFSSPSCR
jgi:hypothetical protein